jgi:hypothetical protein
MRLLIAKFGNFYCEWAVSSGVPQTNFMTLEEFTAYYNERYTGARNHPGDLSERLARVEQQGTSDIHGTTSDELLISNSVGGEETPVSTVEELIAIYRKSEVPTPPNPSGGTVAVKKTPAP